MRSNNEITDQLKQASEGLQWMSESEYPFEVFLWENKAPVIPEQLVVTTGHSPDTPVETITVDDFFSVALAEEDWYEVQEKMLVSQYQTLLETIKSSLTDPQVYRVGTIEIDVYIVGKTPEGYLAGLSTKVVET